MKKSQKVSTDPQYQQARFLLSAAKIEQLPADTGIEVAFIGHSNTGKSSVLNCLTQSKIARVSKTPGRTQLINVFPIDDSRRLIDLPGYGYAEVPLDVKKQWAHMLNTYLQERTSLKGLILVMDIRHPLKEFDRQMLDWCSTANIPVHILLNKADKLTYGKVKEAINHVQTKLNSHPVPVTVQSFSTLKKTGLDALREILDQWYT